MPEGLLCINNNIEIEIEIDMVAFFSESALNELHRERRVEKQFFLAEFFRLRLSGSEKILVTLSF